MKKISPLNLASFSLLSLSFLLWNGVWFASAQESSDDEACDGYRYNKDQMFEDIFEEASVSSSIQIADMFGGNPKEPEVKDLYLNVYKLIDQSPADEALSITADNYQYTQTELCNILGGSLQPFLDTSTSTLDVTELQEMREEVVEAYQEELERTTREQEMFLDSYGKEIFANGDTSDSSFDVLYDLDIIEYLLFGEDTFTTTGGGDINFDSSDNDNPADSDNSEADDEEVETDTDTTSDSTSTTSTTESEPASEETSTETDPSDEEAEEDTVDPATCAVNDAFQDALTAYFEENGLVDPTAKTEEESSNEGATDATPDADTGDSESEGEGDDSDADEDADDGDDLMIASEPHSWEMPDLCGDIFCLFINFKNLDDTTYATSDNCVQCHLDYILEGLRETTSKPLVPGKVSGNLMEPSICKKAAVGMLTKIDFHFTVATFPISTPPSDDIVTNVDFCAKNKDLIDDEENYDLLMNAIFKDFCSEDAEVPETLTDEQKERLSDAGQDLNDEIKAAEMRAPGTVTIEEILEQALAAHQTNVDAVQASFERSNINARFEDQANFYKRMEYEMDQMTTYFQVFYDMIVASQATAEDIKNRPISTN